MVFMHILGSVPFVVGFKGKEGHPLLEYTGVPSKISNPIFTTSIFSNLFPPKGVHEYFGLGTV